MKLKEIFAPPPPKPPDLTLEQHLERWQCQPPLVRLWRLRYRLLIPLSFLSMWMRNWDTSLADLWDIAQGSADIPMKYWFSTEEVKERLRLKRWTERSRADGTTEEG